MSELLDDLLEAWEINNQINLYILRWIPPEGLEAVTLLKTGKPSRGRNVARIFSHMHEVRCSKLERNLEDPGDLPRFEGSEVPDAARLRRALGRSGTAVAKVVRDAVDGPGSLEGWKRSPVAWLMYLVSHDSHHRGQIAQALKQSGVRPPQEVSYGVWGYWGGYDLKEPWNEGTG
ncbi:MAG: DinB family protein [Gemmatimonadota bacterium]